MLLQNILLGFILATLYGAAFHLYKGGSIWRLLLYIAFAWIGFWGGHFLADLLGWTFLRVGTLNIGMATLTSCWYWSWVLVKSCAGRSKSKNHRSLLLPGIYTVTEYKTVIWFNSLGRGIKAF